MMSQEPGTNRETGRAVAGTVALVVFGVGGMTLALFNKLSQEDAYFKRTDKFAQQVSPYLAMDGFNIEAISGLDTSSEGVGVADVRLGATPNCHLDDVRISFTSHNGQVIGIKSYSIQEISGEDSYGNPQEKAVPFANRSDFDTNILADRSCVAFTSQQETAKNDAFDQKRHRR